MTSLFIRGAQAIATITSDPKLCNLVSYAIFCVSNSDAKDSICNWAGLQAVFAV